MCLRARVCVCVRVFKMSVTQQFLVHGTFLEIYNDEIRDLLQDNEAKLELKEDTDHGVYVKVSIKRERGEAMRVLADSNLFSRIWFCSYRI
jgi:hypothetical protein